MFDVFFREKDDNGKKWEKNEYIPKYNPNFQCNF